MGDMSRNFDRSEFACKCGCGEDNVSIDLVDQLQRLRNALRIPLVIHSGVRCAAYNKQVGGAPDSAHVPTRDRPGEAADIRCIASRTRWRMLRTIFGWMLFNRIGIGENFIHVDVAGAPEKDLEVIWHYYK